MGRRERGELRHRLLAHRAAADAAEDGHGGRTDHGDGGRDGGGFGDGEATARAAGGMDRSDRVVAAAAALVERPKGTARAAFPGLRELGASW